MATLTIPADGACDYILTTNVAPELSVAYQEDGDAMPHAYTRANAGKLVKHLIAGRSAPLAFRDLTVGRSDVFTRTFIVEIDTAGAPATILDRAPFDPLLALIEYAAAPYVAVIDGHGERWFTAPEFQQSTYTWDMHEHQATVEFTEVATVPIPLITDDPWHP